MNKKIIAIIVLIIAILIFGFFFYTNNTVKVGNSYFAVPEGYHVVDEGKYVNVTSGKNDICLYKEVSDENINKSIANYAKNKKNNNDTLKYSKLSSGDVNITKSVTGKNNEVIHYWFTKNGKTYEAFTWSGNSNSDNLLKNLIDSMKPAI